MYARNFELTLDGDWQTLPIEDFFIALQFENPSTNSNNILYRFSSTGAERTLEPGDAIALNAIDKSDPFQNEGIQVKGTDTEELKGEQWLLDYQVA